MQFLGKRRCLSLNRTYQLLYLQLELQSSHLQEFKLMAVFSSKWLFSDFFITVSFLFIRTVPFNFDNSLLPPW